MKHIFYILALSILFLFNQETISQNKIHKISNEIFSAGIASGSIVSLESVKPNKFNFPVKIFTSLEDCETEGEVTSTRLPDRGIEYSRLLRNKTSNTVCRLVERFSKSKEGLHCEIEIYGTGEAWSTKIKTNIAYRICESSRIWAPWGDPRVSKKAFPESGMLNSEKTTLKQSWADPLSSRTFFNDTLFYGAPYFKYNDSKIPYCPFQWNLLCMPLVSILEQAQDVGLSVVLNPSDDILDLTLNVQSDGTITFDRLFNRISSENVLKFSFDIITHEADWRGGLRWISRNFPEYFNPVNPKADAMAGTGAYSDSDVDFDVAKMKKMAFNVNWRASLDFPYMGMFIPPVSEHTEWTRFGGRTTSIAGMEQYAKKMKGLGFHVLSYFNVTEFGTKMNYPLANPTTANESDLWKSANDFLSSKLQDAIPLVSEKASSNTIKYYPKTKQGGAYFTWEEGIVMDCGEPVYKDFLLNQAQKHIHLIPSSDGICIDRMDWLRIYNEKRDDGISLYMNRPARSLITSWKNLMKDLCPLMHKNDKVIFVNNHDKRIDLLRDIDGIFDEFTYSSSPLNLTALLCINKPALGWTTKNNPIKLEGADNFFQKYLYMGVYPMAPFPGNDHSILPEEWTDQQYMDYGLLLEAMRGKKWILEPHCIEVQNGLAKANLFKVPGGYVVPVVFGAKNENVIIAIRNVASIDNVVCKAIYPGKEEYITLKWEYKSGVLKIQVPLIRSCAMVKIEKI